mgnify:CR=1 FL=1|tara:strand:+ start:5277 stop:6605 length:1329 start_codon:yes stop_codon:yes gene_type:complete
MELILILSQIIILLAVFSLGYPIVSNQNKNSFNSTNFLNHLILNIVIQINIILLLTFINMSLEMITKIYFLYLFVMFILIAYKNILWFYLHRNLYYAFFIIFFFLSVDIAHSLTLDWDGQIVWFYKTLNFYNEGTIKNLTNLPLGDGYSYPYLGSLIWAFFWKISFITEEYSGRLVYAFLYIIALFSLSEKLKVNFISKIVFSLFLLLLSYKYIFFGGSQDILIFCFISFLAFYVHDIFLNKIKKLNKINLLLIPLIFNCLIWTKDEGVVYSFILLFILTFFSKIKLNQKMFLISSTILLFLIRIFVYKFHNLDITINSCCYDYSPENIFSNIFSEKTFLFLKHFIFFGFLKNYFFIFGIIFLIISFYRRGYNKKTIYIYLFYLFSFGFLFIAHIAFKDNIDLSYMLKVNMHRLVFALSPFFILIFVEYYNSLKIKYNSNQI